MWFKFKLYIIKILLNNKEEKIMAELYATLIINGKREFSSVPKTQKEKVKQILIDAGCEDLIQE